MKNVSSRVGAALSSMAVTATLTLALGWPSPVNAVGEGEQAAGLQGTVAEQAGAPDNVELAQHESKLGDLVIEATLADSEVSPEKKVVRLSCKNPTDGRISGKLQLALTRTSGGGFERVMPSPQVVWQSTVAIDLDPMGDSTREVTLPKAIAAEVKRIERLQEQGAAASKSPRARNVYFNVEALPIEQPEQRRAAARQRGAAGSSKSAQVAVNRLSSLTLMK